MSKDNPRVYWEYGVMRPALMPDMSGRSQWIQIVGSTFRTREKAEAARRRIPELRQDPTVICRRLVSDWGLP